MKYIHKKPIISLLVFLLLLGLPTAQARQVTATGMGSTEQEAVNDALRGAVEQAVGTLINSETLMENYQIVNDQILATSRGYINGFEILERRRQPDGVFAATVRAEVDTNPNSALLSQLQRLNLIKHGLQDPRIAVIVPEMHLRYWIPDPAGETAIIRKLLSAGFTRIVDKNQIAAVRNIDTVRALMNGDVAAAKSIATQFGVDYLLIGEAFSEYAGQMGRRNIDSIISCRAQLEARLVKADTGQIVAANSLQAGGVGVTESTAAKTALGNAGEMMGDYMVEQLMKHAGNMEKGLKLTVTGISSFSKVAEVERALRGLKGVKNVYIRDYSGNIATIELDATVSAQILAGGIGGISAPRLEVTEISGSAIKAAIRY